MDVANSSLLRISFYNSATNFTSCFKNVTITPEQKKLYEKCLREMFKTYHGWLGLPLVFFGIIFTTIYVLAVYRAIKLHRVSRKCYVLLLNRSIGDILACFFDIIIVFYVLSADNISRDAMQLFDIFFIGTFWSAMVSYVSLSVLKLYAIAKPLHYRNNVTMIKCIYIIVFSWIVFFLLTFYALTVTALVKIPVLNNWSGCRIETCMRPMYIKRNYAVVIVYSFTIICFLITLILVHKATELGKLFHRKSANNSSKAQKKISTVSQKISNRFPLWKLALNVLTFTIFNMPYIFFAIWVLVHVQTDHCYFQQNYINMMRFMGIIRLCLLMRIIMDPIISFFTDLQVRKSVLLLFKIESKVIPFISQKDTQSEENSSENIKNNQKTKTGANNSTILTTSTQFVS